MFTCLVVKLATVLMLLWPLKMLKLSKPFFGEETDNTNDTDDTESTQSTDSTESTESTICTQP